MTERIHPHCPRSERFMICQHHTMLVAELGLVAFSPLFLVSFVIVRLSARFGALVVEIILPSDPNLLTLRVCLCSKYPPLRIYLTSTSPKCPLIVLGLIT